MHAHINRRLGFTLIETIVVISITTLLIGVLAFLLVYFYQTNAHVLEQATAAGYARRGVTDVTKYLREAAPNDTGPYPIVSADTSSLTFYADVDNDSSLERLVYFVDEGVLTREVGVGVDTTILTLTTSLVNDATTPVFRYFDETGTELAIPIPVEEVASVKITLVVEVNTDRGPAPFTLSGVATLRNRP